MANRIRSIELDNGVVANFLDGGKVEIVQNKKKVTIHTSDLETIRDTAKKNSEVEAAAENGVAPTKQTANS